ncbi:MAG: hypothetical protein AAFV53_31250 [Myxococcota bacterium]
MMMTLWMILALACAEYAEEDFLDDLDAESCHWQTDCYNYQTYDDCLSSAKAGRTESPATCTFNPDAAEECIRDYPSVDCPGPGGDDAAVPTACMDAWDCSG